MTRPLILLGSTPNILMYADHCDQQGTPIAGIIDRDFFGNTSDIDGIPYIGSEDTADWHDLARDHDFFITINGIPGFDRNLIKRQRFIDIVERFDLPCPNLIDPESRVARTVRLGRGIYIGQWLNIQNHAIIGDFCQIYGLVGIGHHSTLGKNVVVQRTCVVGANCTVGDNTYLGIGAKLLKPGSMSVGSNVFVHPGVTVMRDIEPGEVVGLTGANSRRVYNSVIL